MTRCCISRGQVAGLGPLIPHSQDWGVAPRRSPTGPPTSPCMCPEATKAEHGAPASPRLLMCDRGSPAARGTLVCGARPTSPLSPCCGGVGGGVTPERGNNEHGWVQRSGGACDFSLRTTGSDYQQSTILFFSVVKLQLVVRWRKGC